MNNRDVLLEVKDLRIQFPTEESPLVAVDGIDFHLKRGETLGIVGESGSGKSVTALSIMRLLRGAQVSGSVLYRGAERNPVDLSSVKEKEMARYRGRHLAMIFQEPMTSLNPVMPCGEQIAEAIRLHKPQGKGTVKEKVMAWLERVQLSGAERIYRSYAHELSGGQKQRIMIAMALSGNPEVLIADEPTTALDVTVQQAVLDLIKQLRKDWEGGVIFISHDLGVIAEIADRVLVMQKGKIVEEGPVQDVFRQPAHPYTKGLIACRPPLSYRPRRLPTIEDFTKKKEESLRPEVITPAQLSARLEGLTRQAPLLEVEQLKTWFPVRRSFWGGATAYVKAVDGVSFEVFPGETLGLVGESGCGKTTLGRSLLNLVKPTAGKVRFRGETLSTLPAKAWKAVRKEMQIIFQDPYASLNPRQPVGEAIVEPMRVHGLHRSRAVRVDRAKALLELVGMESRHYSRYPHEFSGGQRQRICIARALAVEPSLLVCDESVSALDVSVQARVLNLLMDLRETYQLTLIFISHDLSVVKIMSDRIMVMNKGKVQEIGAAEEVYRHPHSAYTRKLIAAVPGERGGLSP